MYIYFSSWLVLADIVVGGWCWRLLLEVVVAGWRLFPLVHVNISLSQLNNFLVVLQFLF
jgi:hypothetical protein